MSKLKNKPEVKNPGSQTEQMKFNFSSNKTPLIYFVTGLVILILVFNINSEKLNHYLIPEFVYGDYTLTVDAYKKTGLHMQDKQYGEDPGACYYTTIIAITSGMTGTRATQCFYFFIIWGSFLIGSTAAFKLFNERLKQVVLITALFVAAYVAKKMGSHYSLPSDITIGILPWLIYFFSRNHKSDKISIAFFVVSGFIFASANFLRNGSGIQLIVFFLSMLIFSYKKLLRRELIIIFLCAAFGYVSTTSYYTHIINKNRQYSNIPTAHPVGPPLYIGMGFLANSYGIYPKDESSYERAYFVKGQGVFNEPVYTRSENFEKLMIQEYKKLILAPDLFFLKTLFAKIGIFLMYFIFFANAAILSFSKNSFQNPFMKALVIGLAFSSCYGIAFVPHPQYIHNFFTFSVILGAFSINLCELKNRKMILISIAFILISLSTILFIKSESALIPNRDPKALDYKL